MRTIWKWAVVVSKKTDEPTTSGEYSSRVEAEAAAGGKPVTRVQVLV